MEKYHLRVEEIESLKGRNYDLVINMNGRSEDVIADMIMMYIGE